MPVTLNDNGQETHNSVVGGLCTILWVLGVATYFALSIRSDIVNPNYYVSPTTNLFNNGTYQNSFEVDTSKSVLAILINSDKATVATQDEVNQNILVSFSQGAQSVPAVYCTDLFAKEIEEENRGEKFPYYT